MKSRFLKKKNYNKSLTQNDIKIVKATIIEDYKKGLASFYKSCFVHSITSMLRPVESNFFVLAQMFLLSAIPKYTYYLQLFFYILV